jgi:hypothetical protein
LKLNSTRQFLLHDDDVNILGGSVRNIKNNTEATVVASKETVLEVNADFKKKTKYMVRSRDQNAGRSYKIKINNTSFERAEQLNILGTTL